MKRFMLLVVGSFLLLPSANASVVGTAHDTEVAGAGGPCTACHVPHQAGGERFSWAQIPVFEGKVGVIAALCGSCHHSGEGYGAVMTRAHSDDYVYGANSHGQKMYLKDPPPGTDVLASGLPSVDTAHGYFECTTCHSVHDDTYRPFLRDDPNVLCARCHRMRHYVDGVERGGAVVAAGSWGIPSRLGAQNPGSHPVGEDVIAGRTGAPAIEIPPMFRTPSSPAPQQWSLGGHLTKGSRGGVTCITCHAVHGVQPDPDDVAAAGNAIPPGPGFLVVSQQTASISGYSRPIPNGAGGASDLCEACHGVANNPAEGPGRSPWGDSKHNVNPGRPKSFSHPVDSYSSSVDARVSLFPNGWPEGPATLAGNNVGPVPICESCHVPHPAAELLSGRGDVRPGAGPSILRAPTTFAGVDPLCNQCHSEPVEGHHPVNKAYDSTGVPYLQNALGGANDLLTCSTCHTTAHNWEAPSQAGLDPKWLPSNNGRSSSQEQDMYNQDTSKTCMDCHYFMDGDGASVSPTLGTKQTVIAVSDEEYRHFQTVDKSMGTHYIGLIHEGEKWRLSPLLNIFDNSRSWKDQNAAHEAGLAPGWSRFGGEDRDGSRVLVCESCHELQPKRNGGFRHMLLAPYEEGQNGIDEYPGDSDGHDVLCLACHGIPAGSHPMTGMMVSRTKKPINLMAEWIRPVVLAHATMDTALGALSCDSCHQTHDANSESYSFMLDAPSVLSTGSGSLPGVGKGLLSAPNPAEIQGGTTRYPTADGRAGTYATPTLEGRGGDFTGLCEQCHFYYR